MNVFSRLFGDSAQAKAQVQVNDDLTNFTTQLGGLVGKQSQTRWAAPVLGRQFEYNNAFRTDWIARKAVSIPADDAVREWRDWQGAEEDTAKIIAEESRLQIRQKVRNAIKAARLLGGSALLIGDGAEDVSEELRSDSIAADGLQYVNVLTKDDLHATDIDNDPASPTFGKPVMYHLRSEAKGSVEIHPSRLVVLHGATRIYGFMGTIADIWGDSVLMAADAALRAAGSTGINIAELTHEAKIDVVGVKDLATNFMTPAQEERYLRRWNVAAAGKSLSNILMLDAEDEYNQKAINFSSLTDVYRMQLQVVSGAVDIPVTRFLGQSPAGMNATGESDLRNYYDSVRTMQTLDIGPAMHVLDEALIRSALGKRPDEIAYEWFPLWQTSAKEKAEIAKANADAVSVYQTAGIAPAEPFARAARDRAIDDGLLGSLDNRMKEWEEEGGLLEEEEQPTPEGE